MRDITHDSRTLRGCFVWISRRKNLEPSTWQGAFLKYEGMYTCGYDASLGFLQPYR